MHTWAYDVPAVCAFALPRLRRTGAHKCVAMVGVVVVFGYMVIERFDELTASTPRGTTTTPTVFISLSSPHSSLEYSYSC